MKMNQEPNKSVMIQGTVVSKKTPQTAVVEVRRFFKHRRYGKFMIRDKRYLVHDPKDEAKVGAVVKIKETRPLSARKRFIIV